MCGTEDDTLGRDAVSHEVPEGDEQLAREGDDHLLAQAGRVLSARSKPLNQSAVLLELEKAPSQLDHAASHPSIPGSGEPFLPTSLPAFVRRTGEARVASDGAPAAQIAGQHFLDQHIGRVDTNANHPQQKENHEIWPNLGSSL